MYCDAPDYGHLLVLTLIFESLKRVLLHSFIYGAIMFDVQQFDIKHYNE